MPTSHSHIIRTTRFNHKHVTYDVAVFWDPADQWSYHVDVTSNGQPVIITYPDGYKATLGYVVSASTRFDMARTRGVDALADLAATAESDIRMLV